ncbi:MAG: SOS response-associated peptidase [Candidatus Cloacimonetes bacterium]|jgi:putative SOS response-associated peptidase YedK|nr:SOS response-associated peptidase [Candidatus Cloacimonadota bacterium]MCB5286492.1 SOS response-associated peptidase [Candidatus Cloacimonadota bacterium]MCK9185300.1 SOS response-associated peptidase [Candidatus Cloacimonadota bacterium]MCK9584253.1 SOS response-associated peptidase [Candidatus Cloacimonadota bacterium]MDY0228814.1 SOS response-associated peptidase [Candidatus Cloacimonadaceae bacterium]
MCGRFAQVIQHKELQQLSRELKAQISSEQVMISYNVAPTQPVMAIVSKAELRYNGFFRWGLIPSWMKQIPKTAIFNIRCETITQKPSFKASFIRRRALVPINGFYEWQAPQKTPYYIYPAEGSLLYLAAIYDVWQGDDGSYLPTLGIITTEANAFMQGLHHRMPVIIHKDGIDPYLDPKLQDVRLADQLLIPAPDDLLCCHRVNPAVNKVANNSPDLIRADEFWEEIPF